MAIQTIKDSKTGLPKGFQVQMRVKGFDESYETFDTFEEAAEHERKLWALIAKARSGEETRRVYARQARPVGVVGLAAMRVSQIAEEFAKEHPGHSFALHWTRVAGLVADARVCDLDRKWTKAFCERLRKQHCLNKDTPLTESSIGFYISCIRRYCYWKAEELGLDRPRLGLSTDYLEAGWNEGRERRLRGGEEVRIREELGRVGSKTLWGKGHAPGAKGKPFACARHYQLIFDFAIETCARETEMLDLPWREIDMERRMWFLPAKRAKSGYRRKIYLTPRAMDILRELWEQRKPGADRVFNRLPKTGHGFRNTWRDALDRLGIEDLLFHDLKHEGITRHKLAKTFEPEVLMRMVGHKSAKMAALYFNPEDEEVHARMEAAIIQRSTPAAPVQSTGELFAHEFEQFLSSLASNPIDLGAGAGAARAQMAKRMREILARPSEGAIRL